MNSLTNRRDAIKTSLAVGLGALLPTFNAKSESKDSSLDALVTAQNVYLVKHGHHVKDTQYLWSILRVTNEAFVLSQIQSILNSHQYYSKIAYSTNDKFKYNPARDLITLALDPSSGISFKMVMYSGNPQSFQNISAGTMNIKNTAIYNHVLTNISNAKIIEKSEDRFGPSTDYNDKFVQLHGLTHEVRNVKSNLLLQLNDLISGLCYSIITSKSLHSTAKININNYFNAATSLSSKKHLSLINLTNIEIKKANIQ